MLISRAKNARLKDEQDKQKPNSRDSLSQLTIAVVVSDSAKVSVKPYIIPA